MRVRTGRNATTSVGRFAATRSRCSAAPMRSARRARSTRSTNLQRPEESRCNRRRDAIPCPVLVRGRWLIAAVLCPLCAPPAAPAGTKLVVTGRGWGHGVGMSQWGAYGYALHGWRWQRILAHYYPGTRLADAPVSKVRVLLADEQTSARIGCAGDIRVSDRTGRGWSLKPGHLHRELEAPASGRAQARQGRARRAPS